MNNGNILTRRELEPYQFIRWVLFLVNAANAAGIERLTRQRLHFLMFVSFASSSFYGIRPLRQRAQRTAHGPYYRAAHIALGALALSGLVEVQDFEAHIEAKKLQFEAEFRPTEAGLKVAKVLRETRPGAKLYHFLLELCLGAAEAVELAETRSDSAKPSVDLLDRIFESDLSYRQAVGRKGDDLFIQESPEEESATVKGLKNIDRHLRQFSYFNPKDILSAYQKLLVKRSA